MFRHKLSRKSFKFSSNIWRQKAVCQQTNGDRQNLGTYVTYYFFAGLHQDHRGGGLLLRGQWQQAGEMELPSGLIFQPACWTGTKHGTINRTLSFLVFFSNTVFFWEHVVKKNPLTFGQSHDKWIPFKPFV